jgi:hypothetical protein
MCPEIFVAARRSVSADDVNLGVSAAHGSGSIRQNIKNPRIEVMHLSGAMVAEEVIELRQSFGNICVAVTIDDIQMLPRMSVEEPQMALLYGWGGSGYGNHRKNRKQRKDANTQNVYLWILIGRWSP